MKFEIYADKDMYWRWRLVAANGVIVAVSPPGKNFTTKRHCMRAVQAIQDSWSWTGTETVCID